ncbi:MAG: HlyC/CorC family transporter [Gemmatimonadetes bacterium]|nr:MAG: HlyC/CorC family transporter [Gemmatimonadota bacterium]PYO78078.1 MAG: HlyC/CorC family transporter [Gemmatimonadota bacterium]
MVLGFVLPEAPDPPSLTMATSSLIAVLGLVAINGFFVAAEFALVAARRSKLDEMIARGDRGAKIVQTALQHLDRYIAGTQLGITIASLALGWIGEPVLAGIFDQFFRTLGLNPSPTATHVAAVPVAFFLLTFFHIVLGELAPKSIALANPEKTARAIVTPLMLFSRFMSPFIWLFNGAANSILRLLGIEPTRDHSGHSPEEIRFLVMQAHAHGMLNETDRAMLAGVLDFHDKKARDVMRPRTDVIALDIEATEQEVWEVLRRERYSRYPVYRESLDDVVGVFLAKDLWLHSGDAPFNLADFVREPMYVPDSRPAERVLDDLRRTRAHMAVVLDEYGGTAGIVTMEDLVEEVVGDIADEYDFASRESIVTDGVLELAGSMSLIDVRSDYRIPIPEGDWTTLGGYAFAKLGRLPRMGDRIPIPGGEMEVVAMDGRRIAALRIHRAGIRQPPPVPQPA